MSRDVSMNMTSGFIYLSSTDTSKTSRKLSGAKAVETEEPSLPEVMAQYQ